MGAKRSRLTQFHAGRVDVKIQGSGPSSNPVYQPTPKPSPLCGLRTSRRKRESYDCLSIEWDGSVMILERMIGFEPL